METLRPTEQEVGDLIVIHRSIAALLLKTIFLVTGAMILFLLILMMITFLNNWLGLNKSLIGWEIVLIIVFQIAISVILLKVIIGWVTEYYVLRKSQLIIRKGFLYTQEEIHEISSVRAVHVFQGLFGKLFDYGNLRISSIGREIFLDSIPRPHHYEEVIQKLRSKLKTAGAKEGNATDEELV